MRLASVLQFRWSSGTTTSYNIENAEFFQGIFGILSEEVVHLEMCMK